jgi:hypothetical protein
MNFQENGGVRGLAGSSHRPSKRNLGTKLLTYAVLILLFLSTAFWVGLLIWLAAGLF